MVHPGIVFSRAVTFFLLAQLSCLFVQNSICHFCKRLERKLPDRCLSGTHITICSMLWPCWSHNSLAVSWIWLSVPEGHHYDRHHSSGPIIHAPSALASEVLIQQSTGGWGLVGWGLALLAPSPSLRAVAPSSEASSSVAGALLAPSVGVPSVGP